MGHLQRYFVTLTLGLGVRSVQYLEAWQTVLSHELSLWLEPPLTGCLHPWISVQDDETRGPWWS